MRISVYNMKVARGKRDNVPTILSAIAGGRSAGADVLLLPEACLQGYADFAFPLGSDQQAEQRRFFAEEAETIPGPATDMVQAALSGTDMVVQFGLAESTRQGNVIYNSVALVTQHGLLGKYRKTHNRAEYPYFNQGDELPVWDSPVGRIGALICYDICFPEVARSLACRGAELILMSTAWPMLGHDRKTDFYGSRMDLCLRSSAFANQVFIAAANHCEKAAYSTDTDYYGSSQVVGPGGDAIAVADDGDGLLSVDVDIRADIQFARTKQFFGLNLLQDCRPELYSRYGPEGKDMAPGETATAIPALAAAG